MRPTPMAIAAGVRDRIQVCELHWLRPSPNPGPGPRGGCAVQVSCSQSPEAGCRRGGSGLEIRSHAAGKGEFCPERVLSPSKVKFT